jgi:integrase
MRRKTLTDRMVRNLERRERRYVIPDPEQNGHFLRVPADPDQAITFVAIARRKKNVEGGRQIWASLGTSAYLDIAEARALARDAIRRIRLGLPLEDRPQDSVTTIAERWLSLVVRKEGHRTGKETERVIRRYLLPRLGGRIFTTVGRSDLARVLDEVSEDHGPAQADRVLKVFAAVAAWHAARDDHYQSPVVRGLRRGKTVKRDRILSDSELRAIWVAADNAGSAGAFWQFAVVTGQRAAKIGDLRWSDLKDGSWHIRRAPREKGAPALLKLPGLALRIIERQPQIVGSDLVFGPLHNRDVDRLRRLSGTTGWRLHDARRTCRTLLSRVGVSSEVSERVLGHAIGGVEGVYDRHQYHKEIGVALERLAALVETIISPRTANVVPMVS